MANRYVWSGAGGAGTGADWANAHLTLSAAITAGSAGDVYYIAHDHSGQYGVSTSLTPKASGAVFDTFICVNRAGSVPPVAADITTGAVEGTNAASTILTVNGSNGIFIGITFAPGSGQSTTCNLAINTNDTVGYFENCVLSLLSTGASSRINLGANNSRTRFQNTQARFASTSQSIALVGGPTVFQGPSGSSFLAAGSSVPTTLVLGNSGGLLVLDGIDLSALSGTLVAPASAALPSKLVNCKLHASATPASTPTVNRSTGVDLIGCHSSGNVQRNERYQYSGNLTTETTIVRTGGASDGTTPYSWKMVGNANNRRALPIESFEGAIWNTTLSSRTLTIHTVTDNVTLTDAEIWVEVEYLGSSGSPVSTLITDANATVLTTATNQASSTETWTTTGLTTPLKQKLEVTFTPAMVGPIRWKVKYAKASSTVYVCPKAELS